MSVPRPHLNMLDAQGGMIKTPHGHVSVPITVTPGERCINTEGKVWEFTALPDTAPQLYRWVRVNTDEQAAAWIAKVKYPNRFNQPKEEQ